MDLPEPYEKQINHAKGYLELDMPDEAWDTLDKIDPEHQAHPKVLNLRLKILVASKKWEEGVLFGENLCQKHPEDEIAFILKAQCFYELKRIQEAKQTLLSGPTTLRQTALFHYNLACYQAELGEIADAEQSIKNAVEMDRALLKIAQKDESLKSIRRSLKLLQ